MELKMARLPSNSENQRTHNQPFGSKIGGWSGNIYVGRGAYRAKVHPARLGQSLTAPEARAVRKKQLHRISSGCR